jgi:hypothetical protein
MEPRDSARPSGRRDPRRILGAAGADAGRLRVVGTATDDRAYDGERVNSESQTGQRRWPMVKGALVTHSTDGSVVSSIPFRYDPATLRRNVSQSMGGEISGHPDTVRFAGQRVEVISVDIEFGVDDALDQGEAPGQSPGVAARLAALELLAYPRASEVVDGSRKLAQAEAEAAPSAALPVNFVWGPRRVLPVRLIGYEVTDETFDRNLNAIGATVAVSMRVIEPSRRVRSG